MLNFQNSISSAILLELLIWNFFSQESPNTNLVEMILPAKFSRVRGEI